MNLESDKRLNIQLRLDFSSAPTGEARQAGGEDIESLSVTNEPERPADTRQSCQRNFSNRRVRTRTHGGVGGAEPRGSPLSRSQRLCALARSCRSGMSAIRSLPGVNRTSDGQPNSIENDPEQAEFDREADYGSLYVRSPETVSRR